ncbi:MAG: glucose-6-phosphate isomerase family protein [Candidatus Micrarchaeota archaeon]
MKVVTGPLTLQVDGIGHLSLEGKKLKPDVRTLEQMKPVLLFDDVASVMPSETPMYYMYRGVALKNDEPLFAKSAIRYDLTVIPFVEIGREHNKTLGHYHAMHDAKYSFTEVYQVLEGEAHYVLQKRADPKSDKVDKVYWVHAVKGDKVVIPPNFGHVTINPTDCPLVMANLVEKDFKSEYEPYKRLHGAAYYDTEGGLVPNDDYSELPEAVQMGANEFTTKVSPKLAQDLSEAGLYALYLKSPKLFDFLADPGKANFGD